MIKLEELTDYLSTAFEGIGYWVEELSYDEEAYAKARDELLATITAEDITYEMILSQLLNNGGELTIVDTEGNTSILTLEKLEGVIKDYSGEEEWFEGDAEVADILTQESLFGKIIFG